MVSLESLQDKATSNFEQSSTPRISFSSEFLDEGNFITICPNPEKELQDDEGAPKAAWNTEFEFLSGNLTNMMSADELFCEGKLLPFWQMHHSEKLNRITLKSENAIDGPEEKLQINKEESGINWFLDDDPSPRPPKCTVLWKELLRLKKQRASSTSTLLQCTSSSSPKALSDHERKEGVITTNKEKSTVKRIKKGNERTRNGSIRIRPVVNVTICSQAKNTALSPFFSLRKGRLER